MNDRYRMARGMLGIACAASMLAIAVGPAMAANTTTMQIDAPQQDVPQIDDHTTTGDEMAGMTVTAEFSGNTPTETVEWQATGAGSGQATGSVGQGWSLTQSDDTFSNPWTLTYGGGNGLLTGLRIDGFGTNAVGTIGAVFDRTFGFNDGTPGSFLGKDFETVNPEPFDISVTYEGAVGVGGNAPVGDEFRFLDVQFLEGPDTDTGDVIKTGLDGDTIRTLSYLQDTDEAIVPEPASLALVALGGVVMFARRRNA